MVYLTSQKWLNLIRAINFVLLACLIIMSFFVDGNGRFFGLGEKVSCMIAVSFFSCGILLSSILAIIGKNHRLIAVLCLIAYLILAAPAILP